MKFRLLAGGSTELWCGQYSSVSVSSGDFSVSLGSTQLLAKLVEYATTGKVLDSVQISAVRNAKDADQVIDAYEFENVVVSALQDSSSGNQISFDYAKFAYAHPLYDDKTGKKQGETQAGYDFNVGKGGSGGGGVPGFPGEEHAKLDAVGDPADLEYYARFEGVGGNEWLRLDSFSMGLTNSSSVSVSGGSARIAGQVEFGEVTLKMGSSKGLAELAGRMLQGTSIKLAEVEAYRDSGGDKGMLLMDEFRFENVLISSLDTTNAVSNELGFAFTKYSHGHELYDLADKPTGFVAEGYDLATAKAFDGPNPTGDIF